MLVCQSELTLVPSWLIRSAAETMCMKGLILVHLGQRDEGINLVKEGMRKDLSSHICWHVWALIQKSEHKYEDALKSYIQALKFDKVRSIGNLLVMTCLSA